MRFWAFLVFAFAIASIVAQPVSAADGEKASGAKSTKDYSYADIEAAVKAGKLTKEQAQAKLAYLKKAAASKAKKDSGSKGKQLDKKHTDDYAAIEAAVKAGKITKEQAQAKLAYLKKAAASKAKKDSGSKGKQHDKKPTDYYADIEAAVKAGKLTKEQAQAKLAYLKKAAASKAKKGSGSTGKQLDKKHTDDYAAIEAAVKAGKITKEQAQAKLTYLKKAAASKAEKASASKDKQVDKKHTDDYAAIEAAVKAGKITKEQAQAKLAYLKKAAASKAEKASASKDKQVDKKHADYYAAIEAAVKAGKITKEQAQAKLAALKKAAASKAKKGSGSKDKQVDKKHADYYAAIEAAVKAGKITKEQAQAKLAALKKAAASEGQGDVHSKHEKGTDYDSIARKLAPLVKEGLISKEQAQAMIEAARKVGTAKKTK